METYKITKAIRFKLEADDAAVPLIAGEVSALKAKGQDFDIRSFIDSLRTFLENLRKYLFKENGKNKDDSVFKENIEVKNAWLKHNAKKEIVGKKLKRGLTVKDIGSNLRDEIKRVFRDDVRDTCDRLASSADLPLHAQAKRAAIGLLLKRLQAKNALPYLISFVENSNDKNETGDLSLRLKKQTKDIMEQLEIGICEYLPAQSSGLPVAKASFNYYTINKTPGDFETEIEKLQEQALIADVKKIVSDFLNKGKVKPKNVNDVLKRIVSDVSGRAGGKKIWLGDVPERTGGETGASLRQILKNIKSEQKAAFNEFMTTQNPQLEELKGKGWYLFSDVTEQEFEKYREYTKKIEAAATRKNQSSDANYKKTLQSELKGLREKRGALINAADKKNGNENNFKTYKAFAELYRNIAQKHGKILARLKGIEREKVESATLKYWAVIVEDCNRHRLALIPRDKAGECRKWLDGDSRHGGGECKIFWFESFTFRSLRKLCFGHVENYVENKTVSNTLSNTFYREWTRELTEYQNVKGEFGLVEEPSDGRNRYSEAEIRLNEQKKITFYKAVLGSKCASRSLNIPAVQVKEEIIDREFKSLDEFQTALEKVCYLRVVTLSADAAADLKKYSAQIFDIASLDLKNPENASGKPEKYEHADKHHTKIWKEFWTDANERANFEIRLNPEITIMYRQPKQSRVEKYGKGTELYAPNRKNRYLHPQYTLVTTVSEHSNSPTKALSFVSEEEYKKSISEFNKKFKKDDVTFALGIDNGEVELSTLGVYLPAFAKGTNGERLAELSNVDKYGFDVLAIRDLNYKENDRNAKERKMVLNPSYFLNKNLYMRTFNRTEADYGEMFATQFEKKRLLTLDLSTAKVICGHIIANGDVPALFNLWLKHAQRNIFAMNDHGKDKTGRKIVLKNKLDTYKEKLKFAEYISKEKFKELPDDAKARYVQWIFEDRDLLKFTDDENEKLGNYCKKKGDYRDGIVFASSYVGDELRSETDIHDCRHVFKRRDEFYSIKLEQDIKREIDGFNTDRTSHNISNEQLDLNMVNAKTALVANAIGVIDFLYTRYKERFGGEGLVVKEGFDTKKVEEDLEKFSGNIYRILERRLYTKFQSCGLVPPIKNLMAVRADGITNNSDAIVRLGIVCFIDPSGTSQKCPVCGEKLNHRTVCAKCGFNDSRGIMHSNDGIAGFNIAKRGFENFRNEKNLE